MRNDFASRILARITGESLVTKLTRAAHPTHEEIARLAYALYTARGRSNGDDLADWLRAERELVQHHR